MNQRKLTYFQENPDHSPTAIPAKGKCPTCGKIPVSWGWCKAHFRWECNRHLIDTHGVTIGDL